MSRRFYIETSTAGKNQFVSIRRSRSRGNHHHKDACFEVRDCYKVRVDDWDRIKERERCLQDTNTRLVAEVKTLKSSLAAAQGEAHNLCHVVAPQLRNQISILTANNEALRTCLDKASSNQGRHCREEDKLKQAIEGLEKETRDLKEEKIGLKDKVKHLQRQADEGCGQRTTGHVRDIGYWHEQYRYWKGKHENLKQEYDNTCATLDKRTEKIKAYEEILKRRRII